MAKGKRVFFATLSFMMVGLTSIFAIDSGKNIPIYAYPNNDAATYYSSAESLTGFELLSELRAINNNKLKYRVGYDSMPGSFSRTDPGNSSGQVTSFYSGKSASYSGNMNREHVWPASRTVGGRGNDPLEDDIHMVRPTLKSENSTRGNSFFAEGGQGGSNNIPWDPANFGVDSYRGDSARIIFYCVVADSELSLVDKDSDYSTNHTMGKLSDLLKWNLEYPVLERERTRNEVTESLQGNRNPFIDHPEYACSIWGNANSTTRSICETYTVKPTAIELESSELTLNLKETHQMTYTVTPSNATASIIWESTYENIATIDYNGVITPLKAGDTTIVASIEGTDLYATCKVHVVDSFTTASTAPSGCGGNIVTTSTLLMTISLLGIGIIYIKKIVRKKDEK